MISIQTRTAKSVRHLVAQNFSLSQALPPMLTKRSQERQTLQSIVHQMTVLFVTIDDFIRQQTAWRQWRRSPNGSPSFTDAEVLTVALLQGCLKVATLKHAYQMVATDFANAFPHLPSYSQFMARLHALQPLVGRLIQHVLPPFEGEAYLMDSKPIPLCKPIRHGRSHTPVTACVCCVRTEPISVKTVVAGTSGSNCTRLPTKAEQFSARF